jgi:predicted ATP-grasp superfamily ATP-dependent carboligase
VRSFVVTQEDLLLRRSRWFRSATELGVRDPSQQLDQILGRLLVDRAVIVPCSDSRALEAAGIPPSLSDRFPASVPDVDAIATLVDKGRFARLLTSAGVPHPDTHPFETPADVEHIPEGGTTRWFVKPRDSQRFSARYGVKAFAISSRDEAARRLAELRGTGLEVMLQEYIPGPASNHYFLDGFVDREGTVSARFLRRRLRMYPPDFGNSSCMITVGLEDGPGAVESMDRLISALDYRGVFSAEFKRDERDGVFKILEVNARPWWYIEFAARCGVNVAHLAYEDALGLTSQPIVDYAVGRYMVYPYYDYFACRALRRERRLSVPAWMWSWMRSDGPIFAWDDPIPAISELWVRLKRQVSKRIGKQKRPS